MSDNFNCKLTPIRKGIMMFKTLNGHSFIWQILHIDVLKLNSDGHRKLQIRFFFSICMVLWATYICLVFWQVLKINRPLLNVSVIYMGVGGVLHTMHFICFNALLFAFWKLTGQNNMTDILDSLACCSKNLQWIFRCTCSDSHLIKYICTAL